MTQKISRSVSQEKRDTMAPFIDDMLSKYLALHRRYTLNMPRMNHDDFKKHQDACKASVANIAALLKLSVQIGAEDNAANDGSFIELMNRAQAQIKAYEDKVRADIALKTIEKQRETQLLT